VTAIILAGGNSARFKTNKAFAQIEGKSFIQRIIEIVRPICSEILIVATKPEDYLSLGYPVITDVFPNAGPIAGIHAGLMAAANEYSFVTACDMPFLSANVINQLFFAAVGYQAAVPIIAGKSEPLRAVYSRDCAKTAEVQIKKNSLSARDLIDALHTNLIDFANQESFTNINTVAELDFALKVNKERCNK